MKTLRATYVRLIAELVCPKLAVNSPLVPLSKNIQFRSIGSAIRRAPHSFSK